MKRGKNSPHFWKLDLQIHSVTFILIKQRFILGGLIALKPEKRMRVGELIISVLQKGWMKN